MKSHSWQKLDQGGRNVTFTAASHVDRANDSNCMLVARTMSPVLFLYAGSIHIVSNLIRF